MRGRKRISRRYIGDNSGRISRFSETFASAMYKKYGSNNARADDELLQPFLFLFVPLRYRHVTLGQLVPHHNTFHAVVSMRKFFQAWFRPIKTTSTYVDFLVLSLIYHGGLRHDFFQSPGTLLPQATWYWKPSLALGQIERSQLLEASIGVAVECFNS